ncbi:MAG: isochorismate synthase [Armatimonadota bacterium]|nr:isochorismate synthase [Armatimonadota bacterium]
MQVHGLGGLGARLAAAVRAARARADAAGQPVLAWTAARIEPIDPVALFRWAHAGGHNPILWAQPADGRSLVGLEPAWRFSASGPQRFALAREAWRALVSTVEPAAVDHAATEWGGAPVVMGGFAFDADGPVGPQWEGFEAAELVLPRVLAATSEAGQYVLASCVVRPGDPGEEDAGDALATMALVDDLLRAELACGGQVGAATAPEGETAAARAAACEELTPAQTWKALARDAAEAVRRGELAKVVVARAVAVRGVRFDAAPILRRLWADYPTCTLFAVARGGRCFLGATPERLAAVRGRAVRAMGLAGSAPRGASEEEDRRLGDALLASTKDRIEHTLVVDVVREALAHDCTSVWSAPSPSLLKVSNVQHLHTPIVATPRDGATLLDLVGRLHPTPAVGGVPRDAALAWLRRHEGLDRGWYAGTVGWIDGRGDGEFAVAIRCALLGGREAVLFSGCGIVADSDPEAEYAESRLKLRPMLSALGANGTA